MTTRASTPAIKTRRPQRRHRPPIGNRLVLRLLRSPAHRVLGSTLTALRYTARSGAEVRLPVQAAHDRDRLVIMVGRPTGKRWWRHFATGAPIEVLVDGQWYPGTGAVAVDDRAADAYRRAFPRVAVADDATLVIVTLDRPLPQPPALRGRPLTRAWFTTVTVAEFVGFVVPASVGALTASMSPAVAVPALLAAGAVEGAMLGCGQAAIMRRALPDLPRPRWIAATAGAAVLAYAIGLSPSTFAIDTWPVPLALAFAAIGGAVLLASIGSAQWLILRRHVARAGRWIGATAVAWTVGLGVFLGFAMPLWQPGQPLWLIVAIGVVGGLLMAASTSLITGATLERLLG